MNEITATNGTATWPITRVPYSYCFHDMVAYAHGSRVEDAHHDPTDPCPGPHGEMYAAGSGT